jgi:hypothetical protein
MGYWNATCAVSNLPITEKKRAVLIPLKAFAMGPMAGGGVEEADWYAGPIGLHMRGSYDTYGGLNFDENNFAEALLLKWIESMVKQGILLENGEVLKEMPDAYDFWGNLERGEYSLKRSGGDAPLGFVLVLEDVFDAVVKAAGEETVEHYLDEDDEAPEVFARRDLFPALLRPDEEQLAEVEAIRAKGEYSETLLLNVEANTVYRKGREYSVRKTNFISSSEFALIARDKQQVAAFNDFLLFTYAFAAMRKNWIVCNGKTQTELHETGHLYRAVAKVTLAAIDAEAAEHEDE